ncbi:MAG: hypothetical protein MJ082_00800 [Clostridia bacterium]|nr:hypothetical protein [Clostridia bacterium]
MRIKRIPAAIAAVALILCTCVFLSGCFMDTGDFETDEAYYEAFGDITLLDQSGGTSVYSLKDDFYNEQAMVDMKTSVPDDTYVFFCIGIEREMQLEELCLYVRGQESLTLSLSFFVLHGVPAIPMALESPIPPEDPDDPLFSPVDTKNVALGYNTWTSFSVRSVGIADAEGVKRLYPGDVLCIRFNNNTCYGKAENMTPVALTLTNFIVRIKN